MRSLSPGWARAGGGRPRRRRPRRSVSAWARQRARSHRSAASAARPRSSSSTPAPLVADDVERPGHRKGGDRRAAGHRLQDHQPEGVGARGEHRHVGAGVGRGERRAVPPAGEVRRGEARIAAPRAAARRPPPPWSRAGRGGGRPRCSSPPPPGRRRGRPGAAALPTASRGSGRNRSRSTPRVQGRTLVKPRRGEFLAQARRGGEGAGAALVEAPEHRPGEARRDAGPGVQVVREFGVEGGGEGPAARAADGAHRPAERPLGGDVDGGRARRRRPCAPAPRAAAAPA